LSGSDRGAGDGRQTSQPNPTIDRLSGTSLVILAALVWSTGGFAIKFVDAGPMAVASLRALVAAIVFLPFLRPGRITLSWKLAGLLMSYALMNASFVTATKWTAAGNAVALQYAAPLMIFAVQAALRLIKLSPSRVAPIALGGVGIALFLMEPVVGTSFKGNIMGLVSAVGFALTLVFYRALRDEHNASLVCLTNLFAGLVFLPFINDWGRVASMSAASFSCLIYLGAIQIVLAYFLYSKSVQKITVLKASTIALLEPVLNPVWVFLLLGERMTPYAIAGACAIVVGVALDIWLNKEGKTIEDQHGDTETRRHAEEKNDS